MIVTVLPPLAFLIAMFAFAVTMRQWMRLAPSTLPAPDAKDSVWLNELAALQLERRHLYC